MIGMAAVLLTHIDKPVEIPIIASVVRNEGIPTRVVTSPLNRPTMKSDRDACGYAGRHPRRANRHGGYDGRETCQRTDRKIDLARRQDEGHGHGHHRDHCGLTDDVEEIVRVEKSLVAESQPRRSRKCKRSRYR